MKRRMTPPSRADRQKLFLPRCLFPCELKQNGRESRCILARNGHRECTNQNPPRYLATNCLSRVPCGAAQNAGASGSRAWRELQARNPRNAAPVCKGSDGPPSIVQQACAARAALSRSSCSPPCPLLLGVCKTRRKPAPLHLQRTCGKRRPASHFADGTKLGLQCH